MKAKKSMLIYLVIIYNQEIKYNQMFKVKGLDYEIVNINKYYG